MTLGERMLNYRAKNKLTQIQLADLLEISPMAVWRCESGKFKMHKTNEIIISEKLKILEGKNNVSLHGMWKSF